MKVEVHQACVWTCDECGRDNFCRMVKPELTAEEQAEVNAHFGVEDWGDGATETVEMLCIPTAVVCDHCEAEFETEDPRWTERWEDGDSDRECPR